MEFHELADIFPMMSGEEYAALKDDIAANGLREPITVANGKIIDGRNRYNACMELGIEPKYRLIEWSNDGDLLQFVVSMNLHRRHLNESQRAMVAAKLANMRQGARTDLQPSANLPEVSQPEAAQMFSVGERSVRSAKKVIEEGTPELAQAVEQGQVAVSTAAKIAKMPEEQQDAVMEKVSGGKSARAAMREVRHEEKRTQPFPRGKYQVIYADAPWKYDNTGFDEAADAQYPTMTVKEISALPVESLATDASVLFLWATNPLLPEALRVMRAWGFTYKTNMAWVKDKARGKGWWLQSKHELLLIGVRKDTPQPATRPPSAFEADRGPVHSRKPEKAYDIIESMYPTSTKVELFSRNKRAGWRMWGNENANPKRKQGAQL